MAGTKRAVADPSALLASYGITAIPTRQRCKDGDTHAGGTIASLLDQHGADHLRLVLDCVTANPANRSGLWSDLIAAVSDVLVVRRDVPPAALKEAFAVMDVQRRRRLAVRLRPWPVRNSLRALVDVELDRLVGRDPHKPSYEASSV